MTLTEFLLARITEDQEDSWIMPEGGGRMRDECQAKRRIIAWATDSGTSKPDADTIAPLTFLVAIYRDHPDYRTVWEV